MTERSDPSRFGVSNGQRPGTRLATGAATSDVADSCAVVISRLLAAGLDLELALDSRRRDEAARRIRRAMGEVRASLAELHQAVLDAAVHGSSDNGELARPPESLAVEDPHG